MKKITQKVMSEVLGVEQPTISKYINGKLQLSVKDALTLEEELNIPVHAWTDIKSFLSTGSVTNGSDSTQVETKKEFHQEQRA